MAEITVREKLHMLIDNAPDDKLDDMLELLDAENYEYTDVFKAELDAEYEDYQLNKSGTSKNEVDAMVEKILYRKK